MTLPPDRTEEYTRITNAMIGDLIDWLESLPQEYTTVEEQILVRLSLMAMLHYSAVIAVNTSMEELAFVDMVKASFSEAASKAPKWDE